jgi:hypothetical protein
MISCRSAVFRTTLDQSHAANYSSQVGGYLDTGCLIKFHFNSGRDIRLRIPHCLIVYSGDCSHPDLRQ